MKNKKNHVGHSPPDPPQLGLRQRKLLVLRRICVISLSSPWSRTADSGFELGESFIMSISLGDSLMPSRSDFVHSQQNSHVDD